MNSITSQDLRGKSRRSKKPFLISDLGMLSCTPFKVSKPLFANLIIRILLFEKSFYLSFKHSANMTCLKWQHKKEKKRKCKKKHKSHTTAHIASVALTNSRGLSQLHFHIKNYFLFIIEFYATDYDIQIYNQLFTDKSHNSKPEVLHAVVWYW